MKSCPQEETFNVFEISIGLSVSHPGLFGHVNFHFIQISVLLSVHDLISGLAVDYSRPFDYKIKRVIEKNHK
jgi:hypothetical protein